MYSLILTLLDKNLALPSFRHHGNHPYMNLSMVSYDPVRQHIAASFNVLRANIATLCHDAAYRRLSIQSSLCFRGSMSHRQITMLFKSAFTLLFNYMTIFCFLRAENSFKGRSSSKHPFYYYYLHEGSENSANYRVFQTYFEYVISLLCVTAIVLKLCSTQR